MEKKKPNQAMKDLTLVLLYLSKFKERNRYSDLPIYRAWKGYDWDVINDLDEQDLIDQGNVRNKSVYLTPEGLDKARELLEELGIEDW